MTRKLALIPALASLLFTTSVFAQALPKTDLWLAKVIDGIPVNPVKISPAGGYNNQPHFSGDGSLIFYTREQAGKDGISQTDIAAFRPQTKSTNMLNKSPESEYSPTPIPGRQAVSVIRADLDQKQLLWAIDVNNGNMDLLLPAVEPVGYHTWISATEVAMFILGESFTLQIATLEQNGTRQVADNIGRSLRTHPQSNEVLFVDKNQEPWQIAAYNPETEDTRSVMPLFPGSEDFTIDKEGNYWTGNGSKLYRHLPGDQRWNLMVDFETHGITQISRLAIHLDSGQIAFVNALSAAD